MRVAVYHDLPPGGAMRLLAETLRRLRHHELHLFEIDRGEGEGGSRGILRSCVDAVHRLPPALPGLPGGPFHPATVVAQAIATEKRIASTIDAERHDVVLVHPSMHLQAPSLLAHLRTPSLYYAHEPRRLSFEAAYAAARRASRRSLSARRLAAEALERSLRRHDHHAMHAATLIACNSSFTAEALFRGYGRTALVCRPGVDRRLFTPAEAPRAIPAYALAVGALDPVKGHDMVVDALGCIPASERPQLHIAFERAVPGEADRLREHAARSGVELVLHHGIDDATLAGLYRRAVATVCASRLEPFGLTALESLSSGTPVVAIAEGGFRETVRNEDAGVLVDPSPEGIAAGLRAVMSSGLGEDPLRVRDTVVDYTWENTAACLDLALARAATRVPA